MAKYKNSKKGLSGCSPTKQTSSYSLSKQNLKSSKDSITPYSLSKKGISNKSSTVNRPKGY